MMETIQSTPFRSEIKTLFQAAAAIFLVTVIIGILNGLDLIEFDHPTLLTHAHSGALGGITLCVSGASVWLFSLGRPVTEMRPRYIRSLSYGVIVAIALYVVTFFLNNATASSITSAIGLLVGVGLFGWVVVQIRHVRLTIPHLAILAALTTLTLGSVLGVLLQIQKQVYLAGGAQFLPLGAFVSHPGTMMVGYLILAGMAITEWRLVPPESQASLSRLGIAQVALPFLGGLSLMVGSLLDVFFLVVLFVPFQVLGVLIYIGRVARHLVHVHWLEGESKRLFGLSVVFLAVNVALIAYLIGAYAGRFQEIPSWLIFALGHGIFIGVMANGLFGLVYEASRARRSFWPWVDHVLFWGMNAGLVGFVFGLILQEVALKQLFTPIMGTSILLAMLTFTIRLQTKPMAVGEAS